MVVAGGAHHPGLLAVAEVDVQNLPEALA